MAPEGGSIILWQWPGGGVGGGGRGVYELQVGVTALHWKIFVYWPNLYKMTPKQSHPQQRCLFEV